VLGIANMETQAVLDREYAKKADNDPSKWIVIDDEGWDE